MLVNRGICRTARAVFLVKGHTENDCNRMHNLLKALCRNSNCYTPEQFYSFIEKAHDDITLTRAEGHFYNFEKWEDKYMLHKVKGCSKNHYFECVYHEPDVLFMSRAQGMFVVAIGLFKLLLLTTLLSFLRSTTHPD